MQLQDAEVSAQIRFWKKVVKTEGCWLWTGAQDKRGYGGFVAPDGKRTLAHRFSFSRFVGPIPAGVLILHRCDMPKCVRPDHLFAGTHKDNTADAMQKGRQVIPPQQGERNSAAKLTADQVREIVARRKSGESARQLAVAFAVGFQHIRKIVAGSRRAGDLQ